MIASFLALTLPSKTPALQARKVANPSLLLLFHLSFFKPFSLRVTFYWNASPIRGQQKRYSKRVGIRKERLGLKHFGVLLGSHSWLTQFPSQPKSINEYRQTLNKKNWWRLTYAGPWQKPFKKVVAVKQFTKETQSIGFYISRSLKEVSIFFSCFSLFVVILGHS